MRKLLLINILTTILIHLWSNFKLIAISRSGSAFSVASPTATKLTRSVKSLATLAQITASSDSISSSDQAFTTMPPRTSPTFRIGTPPATTAGHAISPEIVFRPVITTAAPTSYTQPPIPTTVRASPISTVPVYHAPPTSPYSNRARSPTSPSPGPSLGEAILICAAVVICYHGCNKTIW
ncbi:MAG TPA: hypothetical protein VJJ81_01320 [Candidatus Babeliales bacterium]|nr:hypothetical protein [Candidatus Babeliales bacterium]